MSRYSEELKQAVMKRMLPPESRSVAELGHHLPAERDPGAVFLPVSDPGPVQPQGRRLGGAGYGVRRTCRWSAASYGPD